MLHLAGKKRVRAGAMEPGNVLIPESCLPILCLAAKKRMRAGAMELGKVLTPERCLLYVVPSRQEASENR